MFVFPQSSPHLLHVVLVVSCVEGMFLLNMGNHGAKRRYASVQTTSEAA